MENDFWKLNVIDLRRAGFITAYFLMQEKNLFNGKNL